MTVNAGVRYDRYRGWLPEQQQLAATHRSARRCPARRRSPRPSSTPGTCSRRASALTYDLTGDGKTVIKGNYGLYWHNPGVGVWQHGNPNTASKSATYTWNDQAVAGCINGDKRWQPGEEGAAAPRRRSKARSARPEHQGAVHARGERLARASADRHDGRARRLRLQDRRRPDRHLPAAAASTPTPCRSPSSTSVSTAFAAPRTTRT